ncbi:MAG: iron-containing alcohol dehydrogenase [Chloroflexi bacterium]|nr:iron-containing alcohol dehydrogenase [Chloroflexota bacterium]
MSQGLETAFAMDAASIKFGFGVTAELGFEMKRLGVKRAMVLTDQSLLETTAVKRSLESLRDDGIEFVVYADVSVEPTDASFADAIRFAEQGNFDGFVAVGGGSVMDTAKVANLYDSHPADFLEYVNAPIGKGTPVPGALKPLIAVPTTAGTGSETSGVAIFDMKEIHAKTGIANRALKPHMGLVDPENTRSMPRNVAAFSGFDVLCHGLESYTALPYTKREAAIDPAHRPAYQGANPMSDVWAAKAIEIVSANIRRAVNDPEDDEARANMCLAATAAGVGFGTAGVHLPHGMSYPVAGNAREFQPAGYPEEHPIIPHGLSVILNAPAVFRYTAVANPARHLKAARLMGAEIEGVDDEEAGELLAEQIVRLLQDLEMPNGLSGVGYSESDIDAFVAGTLPQHRVTKLAPRPTGAAELRMLFEESMRLW